MSKTTASKALVFVLMIGQPFMCGPAKAQSQTAKSEANSLSEIIVTAEKREEPLQDVPESITALGGGDVSLTQLSGLGFETFANRVPGIEFTKTSGYNTQLSMRGISSSRDSAANPQTDTTVGLYLDDAEIAATSSNPDIALYDINRIEVLRGPQGTLYGAGAESGAVRMITNKPDLSAFHASVAGEVNSVDHGGVGGGGDGVVNMPLIQDKVGLRLVGYYHDDAGYIDNSYLHLMDTNVHQDSGGRALLAFQPSDALKISAMFEGQYHHANDDDFWDAYLPFPDKRTDILEPNTSESRIASITVDYDLPGAKLTSATSYQTLHQLTDTNTDRYATFVGGAPGQFTGIVLPSVTDVGGFEQELRIASNSPGSFKYVAGLYYSTSSRTLTQTLNVPGLTAAGLLPPDETFGLSTDEIYYGYIKPVTNQVAAFGDGTYNITDALSASAGLREYHYSQHMTLLFTGELQGETDTINQTSKSNGSNPRFNLAYKVTKDALVYAQVARGFRLGGVNEPVPPSLCASSLPAIGLSQAPASFAPDSLWSYEGGAKSSWIQNRLTVNGDIYLINYSDLQFSRSLACGYSLIQNAGRVQSKGSELEVNFQATDMLRLNLGLAYTDSTLQQTINGIGAKGDPAPFVPKATVNAAVDYRTPLFNDWYGTLAGDSQYVDVRQTAFSDSGTLTLPSYVIGNLRAGLDDGKLTYGLFVDNVANERAIFNQRVYKNALFPALETITARPRTIGARFSYQY